MFTRHLTASNLHVGSWELTSDGCNEIYRRASCETKDKFTRRTATAALVYARLEALSLIETVSLLQACRLLASVEDLQHELNDLNSFRHVPRPYLHFKGDRFVAVEDVALYAAETEKLLPDSSEVWEIVSMLRCRLKTLGVTGMLYGGLSIVRYRVGNEGFMLVSFSSRNTKAPTYAGSPAAVRCPHL